jgi:GNAT superfamily N-acetyltransferase
MAGTGTTSAPRQERMSLLFLGKSRTSKRQTNSPQNNWVFDKRPGHFNSARNFASLKAKCEWGIRNALFYVAKDTSSSDPEEVLGVSMWVKPRSVNVAPTWSEWIDDYVLWLKQGVNLLWYRGRGGLKTDRYWIWKREQAKAQSEIWTDENGYYFCNIVVVSPKCQGKGVGKMLFEIVTKEADREGRKSYLESSRDEPNVRIYERMGFELVKKMVCVSEDGMEEKCDLFCMVREPKTK